MLVEAGIDFSPKTEPRFASVILVIGIRGAKITIGGVEFHGKALATVIGIMLNLIILETQELEGKE